MWHVKAFIFNPVQENTYLLYNEQNTAIVIDPGCYFDEEREILKQFIEEKNLKPILLLNTHCHLDHVFGNKWVNKTWGLKLHIHTLEKQVLDFAPTSGLMWNLPFENYDATFEYIHDNQEIKIGSDILQVIFAPGHSPGHVCFYCPNQQFVIGGDVLFKESIGRTDLPGGNYETLINSIKTKLFTLAEETVVYSGHGSATTIGHEKKYNPFFIKQ